MGSEMMAYIERLELVGFFSGYPLIYSIILSIAGNKSARSLVKNKLVSILPLAYALTGVLYWGLQLRNFYPDYSLSHITSEIQHPALMIWGLASLVFWIPLFRKKTFISLLHSFVFFFLILKTLYLQLTTTSPDKDILKNDMRVYFDSILLNTATFIAIAIFYLLISQFRKKTPA